MLKHTTINGRKIAYWTSVDRPDPDKQNLLFVHGSGGDYSTWSDQFEDLRDIGNIFALDLPGHGQSEGEGEDDVWAYAGWAGKAIGAMELHKPTVIGHSLGAAICLALAHRQASLLSGLVLVGGGAELPVNPSLLEGLKADPVSFIALAGIVSLARGNRERLSAAVSGQLGRTRPDVLYKDFLSCSRFHLTAVFSPLSLPTLVVCGLEDKMTPPALSRRLRELIPGSRLALIEGAGHFVMRERPREFNRILGEFINSLEGAYV
ncbi:MAG: alpha/beta hydrolase [Smithellaceae bacterium]|nr:alpha/beta hydrolase [Smithellaceae bacterium]